MSKNTNEWKRLYDEKGILVYEGFTKNNKPCGAGASYFTNGTVYQEGIFGVKGFLCGREYYPDGTLRFEGIYTLNTGYGPNYPRYGFFQTRDGSYTFEGEFRVSHSGTGYPAIKEPENYVLFQANRPDIPLLLREDEKHGNDSNYLEENSKQDEGIYTFEKFQDMVEKVYMSHFTREKLRSVAEKYFSSDEAQDEIRTQYKSAINDLKANKITDKVFRNGCVNSTAYCLFLLTE